MELPPTILYEKKGQTAIITINRPEAMNALTPEMWRGLAAAFDDFNSDRSVWVAILTGAGDKAFSAGADLLETIPRVTEREDSPSYTDPTKRFLSDIFKPVIAAVNGYCIAGALEIMLAADLRIAAEHATFRFAEVRWGIIPYGGAHVRLPQQIPWAVAMEMLLTGQPLDARRAYEIGLVNRVVSLDQLMPTAIQLAESICKNGPLAVRTAKEIAVRSLTLEPGFVLESALAERVLRSDDAKEGPRAFAEKREPGWRGR